MPLPPGANRWAPHFEDPALEHLSRLTFNGIKDLNAAIKALSPKTNAATAQGAANAALLAQIATQLQTINQNITNIVNNTVTTTGALDCGTFSGF